MINVTVNGETKEILPGTSIAELVASLRLEPRYVAVERNLNLVPRAEHSACVLQAGDSLEIVTLVGGG